MNGRTSATIVKRGLRRATLLPTPECTFANQARPRKMFAGYDVGNYVWANRIARVDVADFMLKQLPTTSTSEEQ